MSMPSSSAYIIITNLKAVEPFRRLQRKRDGMTEERYEGLTDMLSAVSWTR